MRERERCENEMIEGIDIHSFADCRILMRNGDLRPKIVDHRSIDAGRDYMRTSIMLMVTLTATKREERETWSTMMTMKTLRSS